MQALLFSSWAIVLGSKFSNSVYSIIRECIIASTLHKPFRDPAHPIGTCMQAVRTQADFEMWTYLTLILVTSGCPLTTYFLQKYNLAFGITWNETGIMRKPHSIPS